MSEAMTRPVGQLNQLHASILDFERSWWTADAAKDAEIRSRFGFSSTRYYQELNLLLDDPDALAYSPLLVKRLRRLRERRQQNRSARHLNVHSAI